MKKIALLALFIYAIGSPEFIVNAQTPHQPQITQLKSTVDHLASRFGDACPNTEQNKKSIEQLAQIVDEKSFQEKFKSLQRKILLDHPVLRDYPLVFVSRHQYQPDHHNTATMFQTDELNTEKFDGGSSIKILHFTDAKPQLTTLLDLPEGVARDLEIDFDAKKILFSMRRNEEDDYHIYEIKADGTGLKQLTFGSELSDIDPIYLPDGRILFTSTREPKYCMCNRHIMGNLYTMNADGSNITQIGHSTLHEGHAALMPDGRVLYDRWEYVDRNFGDAQGVWTTNPDGTNHAIYWGNNTNSPGGVLDTRIIPDTKLAVATFSSCHDRPWGAIAIFDRKRGLDGKAPVLQTWPPSAIDLVEVGNYDTFKRVMPKYEDPYPISENFFLVSRMTGDAEQMGIYLIDRFGNEILLHNEKPGCFDPMPLTPRKRPPVIPSRVDLNKKTGTFYLADVYQGHGMKTVPRGTVKRLRVVESPEKRFWSTTNWQGDGAQLPAMNWKDFNNKRILGSVPIDKDGSAYFEVPADRFVYFQLLDEQGRMVQSMRSGVIVRPGENLGCVGCHENRLESVPPRFTGTALRRSPSKLKNWHGQPRLFSYRKEVQPVFDQHCVSCHQSGKPAGEKLDLTDDLNLAFNQSYTELFSKGYIQVVNAGPAEVQMPRSWGSYPSSLSRYMLEGHDDEEIDKQINLDRESIDRVLTWIDLNAPYYPRYASAYGDNLFGRSPLGPSELKRLGKLTSMNFRDARDVGNVTFINFTHPERSRAIQSLQKSNPTAYDEAISIIEKGAKRLESRPRADMDGFQLVRPCEIKRENRYKERLKLEEANRAAIREGRRHYDHPTTPPKKWP